jgi:hypothetical protein
LNTPIERFATVNIPFKKKEDLLLARCGEGGEIEKKNLYLSIPFMY